MTVLYLDESGEEGFKRTSSEWFVVAGAFHRFGHATAIRSHYAEYKERHHAKQKDWYFHFQTASHPQRRGFIKHMLELEYNFAAVAIHKPSLSSENFKKKYFLYFYATRLLLEAVTKWMEAHDPSKLMVKFSGRKGLSTDSFAAYMGTVRSSRFVKHDYVRWAYVDPFDFDHKPNRELIGLQMADCFASALGQALEINAHGMTDCGYIRQLSPNMISVNGRTKGYGVKIWPAPGWQSMQDPRFDWYRELG